jgi:hypothetical protein
MDTSFWDPIDITNNLSVKTSQKQKIASNGEIPAKRKS